MREPRVCSKTTDKLMLVIELLKGTEFKKCLVTWDRIDDPEEGAIVVPIITIER